ncbi:hypothetical protein PTSG_06574 [Salpingoeca rosetta]|uniref:Vps16 N-terminal domain-containing protein n=1 Tax=Salpingoeca rosetta (strain ATCC 50818 / BSB-021) TaxID=946362 RepID=F2UG74_SALR5|nr:uncharacterized protein PTSG_06574 [Salpingoeca rosetta]EGD75502.1 hypothetical protein PTSG_06574 [Salpingoeca rosetta]|eukprot:XP_004991959.1 hypothetical protein PTSG_06574 [Salpingoeca rosetta]
MDEERWNEVLRPHTTGEGWQPCGDSFYRMHKVYMNMGWYNPDDVMKSISLGDYIHAVAPYGGPVALTLDRTKVTEVHGMHEVTNVKIFSPAGYRMGTIKWTGDRNIVGLVWASAEHLIIVQEDGACQVHNVTGGFLHAIPPRAELRIGVTKKLPIGTAVKATHMAVSWDEEKVAVFHEGMIRVYAKNFTDLKYELDTDTNVEPTSIVWCGSHSVVAYWDEEKMPSGMLLVVPGSRHQTTFSYVNRVILCPEMDGLRVISDEEHEFLQPVPDEMWSTFLAGDTGESKLYQARVFYEDRSPLADELLRSVKDAGPDAMVQAVQSLMVAAEHEWDPRLIR